MKKKAKLNSRQMAKKISDSILFSGDGVICNRIALKSGTYGVDEKDEGGLCRKALEQEIEGTLDENGY